MLTASNRLSLIFSQAGHSFCHISMLLYPTVVLALEKEFALPYGELLVLMTLGNVLFGVAALPAGWLGDRWHTVGMMIIYFLGLGIALLLTGLASSKFGLASGLALIGLFAAIYHPVGMAWLIRNAEHRGRILGINGFFGSLGVACAALIAGTLTDWIHWRAAFLVPGAIVLALGVGLLVCAWRGLVVEVKTDAKTVPAASRAAMLRAFIVLSVTMLGNGLIFQSLTSVMPKVFAERIGDLSASGTTGAAVLVSLVYLGAMLTQLVGGYLSDKFAPRSLYLLASLAQLPFYVLAASTHNLALFMAVMTTVLFNTIAVPTENVLLARYTPEAWRATAFGAKFVLALGVGALGVPLAAHIHATTGGFYWYFLFLAAVIAVIVVAALWLPGERASQHSVPAPALEART